MAIKNNEILWVTYTVNNENIYCITSNKDRTYYYLYEYKNNDFLKTECKSDNPIELEKLICNKDISNKYNSNKPTNSKKKLLKESVSNKTKTNKTSTKKGSLF